MTRPLQWDETVATRWYDLMKGEYVLNIAHPHGEFLAQHTSHTPFSAWLSEELRRQAADKFNERA